MTSPRSSPSTQLLEHIADAEQRERRTLRSAIAPRGSRGHHVTALTYGRNVPMALSAADEVAADGLEAEVVELRSIHPIDWTPSWRASRGQTGVLCVNDDTEVTNFGEHLVRKIVTGP